MRINTIGLEGSTPGVPEQPYPWTGSYFRGVPLTVSARPAPGYRFVHWLKQVAQPTTTVIASDAAASHQIYSTSITITPTLDADTRFKAVFEPEPATLLAITPPIWTAGFSNAPVMVRAVNSQGDTDANFSGTVTLTFTGPGAVFGPYNVAAVAGVATFASVDLTAGSYTLSASAGALATLAPVGLTVRGSATFLLPGSGVWHSAANWNTGAVPDSPAVSVIIPPNTSANRDVTNNAATTVASVIYELGTSAFRSRINGTAGNPFILASTSGISTVTVKGTGVGHANIEVPGGLVISIKSSSTCRTPDRPMPNTARYVCRVWCPARARWSSAVPAWRGSPGQARHSRGTSRSSRAY